MDQNPPWEADSSSASQEIFRILRKPYVHNRIHNSQSSVPTLKQVNPLQIPILLL
jgi:hypothetical protein